MPTNILQWNADEAEPVARPTKAWEAGREARELPRTMLGGQRAMHAETTKYLPPHQGESLTDPWAYPARLKRSTFVPFLGRAIGSAVGKVFSKAIVLGGDIPSELAPWLENVDRAGNDLQNFAREVFRDAWADGVSFFLVDYPTAPGQVLSRADEANLSLRPFWTRYAADDLIGWRSEVRDGSVRLTQARLLEVADVADGAFDTAKVRRIRVLDLPPGATSATWSLWEEQRDARTGRATWVQTVAPTPMAGMDQIPLVPVYVNRTGFFEGAPPFADLAFLNLAHYQLLSDLRHVEYTANIPVPVLTGVDHETFAKRVKWGPNGMLLLPSGAEASYLEHTGRAIGELKKTIADMEERIRLLSLEPMIPKGDLTAMGEAIRAAQAHSVLQASALALEDALEQGLILMAKWAGIRFDASGDKDSGGTVQVHKDFEITSQDTGALQVLTNLAIAEKLSARRLWLELRRRGVLAADFDPDKEEAALDGEARGTAGEDPDAVAAAASGEGAEE